MVFQEATPAQAGELAALLQELMEDEFDREILARRIREMRQREEYHLLAALDRGRLAGTAMGILCLDLFWGCGCFLVIENVVVARAYRGKGVGGQMLAHLEDWAKARGGRYALLVSGAERQAAHGFYEKCGYAREAGFRKKL